MGLPSIMPYPMPVASDFPANRVSWIADPQRAVLLIHDMQQYFIDAFASDQAPVTALLANIQLLKQHCDAAGIPVVYTAQPGGQTLQQRALLQDFWGPGINDGPCQQKIIEELAPSERDVVLTKWRYSAFCKTDLLERLREQGRDQLIVCGIYAHIGCLMTACDAFMNDVQPFFIGDAVADFSPEHHRMAIQYAADRCAVVLSAAELLRQLGGREPAVAYAASMASAALGRSNASGTSTTLAAPSASSTSGTSDTVNGSVKSASSSASGTPATQAGEAAAAGQPFALEALREQVAALIMEPPSGISDHEDLIQERGLDSVRIMSLVEQWRRSGAEVTFVELAEKPTLHQWRQLLAARSGKLLPNEDYFVW